MHSRVMCLLAGLCICMATKNRLFSALMLENLLLSVICCFLFEFKRLQCGLLHPASCTDRAIHVFPSKTRRPPASKYFLPRFNSTPHPLAWPRSWLQTVRALQNAGNCTVHCAHRVRVLWNSSFANKTLSSITHSSEI